MHPISYNQLLRIFCLVAFGFIIFLMPVWCQPTASHSNLGLQLQAYPAGLIAGGQFSFRIAPHQSVGAHLGLNVTDRRDWGEHDNETGDGTGFGLSWRYYLSATASGPHFGIRTDLWFLTIDWQQNTGESGTTDITVFQPTAQFGYTLISQQSPWVFDATVSLGAEMNMRTKGEPVGEGAILLLGLGVGYQF